MDENKDHLHRQLIRLGDMMGDGMHNEPGGKWISKEYAKILRALGIGPKRKNRNPEINKKMLERIKIVRCQLCKGGLAQVRSGSMRAQCVECGARFQLLKKGKKK